MSDDGDELVQKRVTLRFLRGLDDPAIALVRQCRQPAVLSEKLSRLVSLGLEYQSLKDQGLLHGISRPRVADDPGAAPPLLSDGAAARDGAGEELGAASDEQAAFFLVAAGGLGAAP